MGATAVRGGRGSAKPGSEQRSFRPESVRNQEIAQAWVAGVCDSATLRTGSSRPTARALRRTVTPATRRRTPGFAENRVWTQKLPQPVKPRQIAPTLQVQAVEVDRGRGGAELDQAVELKAEIGQESGRGGVVDRGDRHELADPEIVAAWASSADAASKA